MSDSAHEAKLGDARRSVLAKLWNWFFPARLLRREVESLEIQVGALGKELECREATVAKLSGDVTWLENDNERMVSRVRDLENSETQLRESNTDLLVTKERFDLISAILSASPLSSRGVDEFRRVLEEEFFPFANEEACLDREAEAVETLRGIEKQLVLTSGFRAITSKTIGAVGGGFSSGKSTLVNSFMTKKSFQLPVGIKPVTAIPSYVVSSKADVRATGFTREGGYVEMREELWGRLSHDFVRSFDFNLKKVMPFMTVSTPLKSDLFEYICLVDTPGYNPGEGGGFTETDSGTARECLQDAEFLLWIIGLDATGTIPNSDLEFLKAIDGDRKRLYVVANKAELKPQPDLEDIVEDIATCLEDADIVPEGVSAYSAIQEEEFFHTGMGLLEFLREQNRPRSVTKSFDNDVRRIMDMYRSALRKGIAFRKNTNKHLRSLELDMLQHSIEDSLGKRGAAALGKRLDEIRNTLATSDIEKQLLHLSRIEKNFLSALRLFEQEVAES